MLFDNIAVPLAPTDKVENELHSCPVIFTWHQWVSESTLASQQWGASESKSGNIQHEQKRGLRFKYPKAGPDDRGDTHLAP